MARVLFLIALTTAALSTSVFAATPSSPTSSKLAPMTSTAPETATAIHLSSNPDNAKLNTAFHPARVQTIVPSADIGPPVETDSGWRYLSTLLTTLALIGVIAVRRHLSRED